MRLGRIGEISPHHTSHIIAPHQTSDITSHHITHHKPKEENTEKKFLGRVLGPDGSPHHITYQTFISHQIKHHKEEVLRVFSCEPPKSIPEERKVRELPRKMNIEEVEAPKHQKSTSFIVKTLFKSIPEQRKVRELPRKMNIEEVEEPKKYENYHAKPVSDPFKSIAEHRKVR